MLCEKCQTANDLDLLFCSSFDKRPGELSVLPDHFLSEIIVSFFFKIKPLVDTKKTITLNKETKNHSIVLKNGVTAPFLEKKYVSFIVGDFSDKMYRFGRMQ